MPRKLFAHLALCLLVVAVAAAAPSSKTINVDCSRGQTITQALERPAEELTIVIDGFCIEDLVIRRDFVTVRGKNQDPDLDGIHSATPGIILGGTGGQEIGESVVTVRGGHAIRFEHLFIGEGQANRSGVAAIDNSIVTISDCLVENNPDFGVAAAGNSVLFVVDSTVRGNSRFGGFAVGSGLLALTDSDLLDNGDPAVFDDGGLLSINNGLITMVGGSLSGSIVSSVNSSVELGGFDPIVGVPLAGVLHTGGIVIVDGSSVRARSGSTLQGFTLVVDFSTFALRGGSTLDGNLVCGSGGDAFCDDPAVNLPVLGSTSNCGQCPKP